jgi:hypothetical protein
VQPFSRRPSHQQRDYDSAPPPRASARSPMGAMGAPRPRPAPAPVFHRQAPAPAYSYDPYSQSQHSHGGPVSYGSAPPPPNSLAPVEMGVYANQPRNYQTDRGVAHTNTTNIKPRPTWRTGAMILLAGVFVGGTFGIGVQARRNALDEQANIAAAAANVAPPPQALASVQQQQAAAPGPTALQPTIPPQAPPQAYAQAPANAGLPPGAIVIPPQPGVVVVPAPPAGAQQPQAAGQPAMAATPQQPAQPQAHAQVTPSPAKRAPVWRPAPPPARPSGATLAAKVPPPKKEVAEPADPPEPPQKKGPKKPATDAQSVLQAAIGETTNTL